MIVKSLGPEGEEVHKRGVPFYASYEREIARWFDLRDIPAGDAPQTDNSLAIPPPSGHLIIDRQWAAQLFSFLYQVRRAYYLIYYHIVGVSPAMTRLREAVWDAIFTRNVEWYWRYLLGKMADFSTLITGPTGAGKELIAQAIGRAQYLPIDPKTRRFEHDGKSLFLPVNLAALSPTLIESELFGHVKGAFTGAVDTREGLMAGCSRNGAIFLDEIGEIPPSMQVKLLRVLQTRRFYQLGSRREDAFEGRIISATNQDVAGLIRDGGMREDFYYRLSACPIQAPSLRERFDEEPEEIVSLTLFLLRRIIGAADEGLEAMIIERVRKTTAGGRPWRGNVRELEQFIRNCLAGREIDPPAWVPPAFAADTTGRADWVTRAARADLTLDELLGRYCRLARARYETYEQAAAALNAD